MIFEKVRFKNFFSVGNEFIEIDLQKHKQSVIHGKNGNGKSTLLSAITFGAFNKTIKTVKRDLIVNSINRKNCLVEIELESNSKKYLIRRGIKPNIFEIFEDGVLLDQTLVGDYQDFLEEKILKCSYRTFLQTSIISIEDYKPFMSLPKGDRREFIEDILDIKVFSVMNQLIKANATKHKEELRLLDGVLRSLREMITVKKSHIEKLEKMKSVGLDSLNNKLDEYTAEIATVSVIFETSDQISEELKKEKAVLREMNTNRNELVTQISTIKSQIRAAEKDISFFDVNDDCPTCRQVLHKDHVCEITDSHKKVITDLKSTTDALTENLKAFDNYETLYDDMSDRETTHNQCVSVANSTVSKLNKLIIDVNKEKSGMMVSDDIPEQKEAIKTSAKEAMKLSERKAELNEEQDYSTIMLELFKDSGVKSKIVDQYIPVINKLMNEYLEKLDFFVSFHLDSEFNETIKSRHRDLFTYDSFSAGERQRIDLAMLFTFRQLAKMRNSFSCNLLCMDEMTDSSLDADGIDLFINILDGKEFDNTNLLIISHGNKDRFEERFDGSYEVYKRDGFTQIRD